MAKFEVLIGCNYPPDDTRAEPGDIIDVDEKIGKALLAADAVQPYKAPKAQPTTSTPEPTPTQAETGTED